MKYNVHAGHNPDGKTACGAIGILKESTENRKVATELIALLRQDGHTVYDCTINNATGVSDNINRIVALCNAHAVNIDASIHFNSGAGDKNGNGRTTGVEVLVYQLGGEAEKVGKRICERVSKGLGLRNRGVKVRPDLGVLRKTKSEAILVECCFVDDKDDVDAYNYKAMAKYIAEGILNKTLSTPVPPSQPATGDIWYRAVCGSFNDRNNANARKAALEKDGFTGVFLDAFVKDEKTWYRVVAGSFKSKESAVNRVDELAAKGYTGGFVSAFRK